GPAEGLQNFILTLYGTCLPQQELTRRKGYDIERFFPQGRPKDQPPAVLRCEYLIPIRR
ncbi:MDR efflux pump AcrAB transcriptional activator RobA, partial [Salmonella enterica subsp. enterica serovar Enteritidis]